MQIAIDRRVQQRRLQARGLGAPSAGQETTPESFGHYLLDCPNAQDLLQRLGVTERMLVDWYFGEVAPEVMIEELHTAFELTLARVAYGRYRRDKVFQELIDEAKGQGIFDDCWALCPFMPGYDPMWSRSQLPPPAPYLAELLTDLKDTRKHVKHCGGRHRAGLAGRTCQRHSDQPGKAGTFRTHRAVREMSA